MNDALWYDLNAQLALTVVSPDERVLAYGDGFFTTMAVVDGVINWLDYHQRRLVHAAACLQLAIDVPDLVTKLRHHALVLQHGLLKLIICRQPQPVRGYGFINQAAHCWLKHMAVTTPLATTPNTLICQPPAAAICLTQKIASLPSPLGGLKLLNAQDKVLVAGELITQQQQLAQQGRAVPVEGIVQDLAGNWVEATVGNLFYQLADMPAHHWYTPPIIHAGVAGVMRQYLIDHAPALGLTFEVRPLTNQTLPKLSGLFLTNAVRGITPITQLYLPDLTLLNFEQPTDLLALIHQTNARLAGGK